MGGMLPTLLVVDRVKEHGIYVQQSLLIRVLFNLIQQACIIYLLCAWNVVSTH